MLEEKETLLDLDCEIEFLNQYSKLSDKKFSIFFLFLLVQIMVQIKLLFLVSLKHAMCVLSAVSMPLSGRGISHSLSPLRFSFLPKFYPSF